MFPVTYFFFFSKQAMLVALKTEWVGVDWSYRIRWGYQMECLLCPKGDHSLDHLLMKVVGV